MKFTFSPEDERFRQEVRAFIAEQLPGEVARRNRLWGSGELRFFSDYQLWQSRLAQQGWGAPHWPVEWGGTGWSPLRKHLFMEELYDADGLDYGWQGLHMVAPVTASRSAPRRRSGASCRRC